MGELLMEIEDGEVEEDEIFNEDGGYGNFVGDRIRVMEIDNLEIISICFVYSLIDWGFIL